MSAVVLERRGSRALGVPAVLGLQEGLRILRHPVSLVGAALTVTLALTMADHGAGSAYSSLSAASTYCSGLATYVAAHLVASRDRRARSGELLAATPSPPAARVAGLCVAALVPALACAVLVAALHLLNRSRGVYEVVPGLAHEAQGPLTVLGAALLGTMVARLTRVPGAAVVVMVAMIAWNLWTSNDRGSGYGPLGTYVTWTVYSPEPGWAGLHPGSQAWHATYLLGLCAMAAAGAFLREAARPGRVLAVGALLTGLTAAPAVLQLG